MFAHGDTEWPGVAKVNEEAGEVIQVIGKLMQTHGYRQHWDGTDLKLRLRDELADLTAAIQFVMDTETNMTDRDRSEFQVRVQVKLALFRQWHREREYHE